jgi:protein TonB
MFEQSLIVNGPIAKKTGAFAASLTAQIAFVGAALLIPLAYQDVLPMVRIATPLALPVLASPPPRPQPTDERPRIDSTLPTFKPNVFRPPLRPSKDIFDSRPIALDAPGTYDRPAIYTSTVPPTPQWPTDFEKLSPPVEKPAPSPTTPTAPAAPVRMGGDVLAAKLIKRIVPVYPALAKQARISGTVRLEGIVGKDGTIRDLRLIHGHPLLAPAALAAVKQWLYSPTLLNGQPVEVSAPIDVNFVLSN